MSWKIPKHLLTAGDVLDLDKVNENARTFVEEIDGNLGEHNWADGAFAIANCADDFVLQVKSVYEEVDPDLEGGEGTGNFFPGPAVVGTVHEVAGAMDYGLVDAMTMTFQTANSLLWLIFSGQQQADQPYLDPQLVVAIEVDGVLIPESVYGGHETGNDPYGQQCYNQAHAIAVDCIVPVIPGQHTVRVMARGTDATRVISGNSARLYNREFIAIIIDPHAEDITTGTLTWEPLEETDSVTDAGMDAILDPIVGAINDVESVYIKRHSLNNAHLPSSVVAYGSQVIGSSSGSYIFDNAYKDYDDATTGDPGWQMISDGVNDLEVIKTVNMANTGVRGILVMADIHLIEVVRAVDSRYYYGAFALQFKDSTGVWHHLARTERAVWSAAVVPYTGVGDVQLKSRINVPLRTFITDTDYADIISRVRVVCASSDHSAAGPAALNLTLSQGSLHIMAIQGGTPA